MRVFLISLLLISTIAIHEVSVAAGSPANPAAKARNFVGRWHVKFTLTGGAEKNLVLQARARGAGVFLLKDTGVDDKPVPAPQSASWAQLTNDRVSFSGEVELPLGTCCREIGTLTFKGRFTSDNSISGKLVFVTSITEEESPYGFRSVIGTFTATCVSDK